MGIISQGLRNRTRRWGSRTNIFDFAYLDGFAGPGAYQGDEDDPDSQERLVWGSPIIGVKALAKGRAALKADGLIARITSILIEDDGDNFDELKDTLANADIPRVVECADIREGALGRNHVIHGDFRDHISSVCDLLPGNAYLLAFIDPNGPAARMSAISVLLDRPKTDLIILFPSQRVLRDGGSVDGENEGNVTRGDALFGTEAWQDIARIPRLHATERIDRYTQLYREQLKAASSRDYWIKQIPLRFSASHAEFEGYSLFLLTENADGALKMNKILRSADYRKHWERWGDLKERDRRRREATEGFDLGLDLVDHGPGVDPPTEPSHEEVDSAIQEVLFPAETITWEELKGRLANNVLLEGEIRRGLTRLKKGDWIDRPSDLRNSSEITRHQ